MSSLMQMCRICSDDLKEDATGIFSTECMANLVGEKIRRYLYFSVSINDKLPKKVCKVCLKKLDNIHRFAKMAAEMQEKFRMLLAQEDSCKPKIKIKSLQELNGNVEDANQDSIAEEVDSEEHTEKVQKDEEEMSDSGEVEMTFDVAVEEVGDIDPDVKIDETATKIIKIGETINIKPEPIDVEEEQKEGDEEEEEEEEEEDDTAEEKPNPSLLHSLLIQGKRLSMDMDHDYLLPIKAEADELEAQIKNEPEDPEDEDIAEEIEEDRLNQIIKDEMESDNTDGEEDDEEEEGAAEGESAGSDVEITEMEVKVDPMLYFSNASQGGIEVEPDSQDAQGTPSKKPKTVVSTPRPLISKPMIVATSTAVQNPLVMSRAQQKSNPVIASLKLGKPYKCTVCPRSFITDIGLQNHLWSHLPKSRKTAGQPSTTMMHKNVDMEDSQVYSSNGVLHTALPCENPHLLKYVCPICGKKISTKGNLKVHLETHRPKGKYGCDICGRVFKTAANLYRHKDYHGGVQFPCHECGRVYPTNSTLRAHSITHSNLRPHKCPLCSKTFKRNQDLKFHINQHTGARPYQCPYCPKAFASSGNCFSHRKRMHPLEVERDKERAAEIMG